MAIHTTKELRKELANDGDINLSMVKQMMRVMLEIIDHQALQINNLEEQVKYLEELI